MSTWLVLGALVGVGIVTAAVGLRRREASIAEVLDRYDTTRVKNDEAVPPSSVRARRPVATGLGSALNRLSSRVGAPLVRGEDLAVTDRRLDEQLAGMGFASLCLGGIGAAGVAALRHFGLPLPGVSDLAALLLGAAAGFALPALELRREAQRERQRFARSLSCWLELVAMAQAGGMGVESALQASSRISDDRSFSRLAAALESSRVGGSPWQALGHLGASIGVGELEELAATLSLAGTEGARVRSSLVARSSSLRRRLMAEAEAEANAVTERLFLPSIVMMVAFLLFLMYPAGVQLAHVL